jgi:hypothetical protein
MVVWKLEQRKDVLTRIRVEPWLDRSWLAVVFLLMEYIADQHRTTHGLFRPL